MENASKALIIAGAILVSILLITIGIVLVNSGSGVADRGTANMNSQKIQTFNSQFTAYEGKKKGAEIKSLINLVHSSNATDEEHYVIIFFNEHTSGSDFTGSMLNSSKTYTVTLEYYDANKDDVGKTEPGYIYKIHVDG